MALSDALLKILEHFLEVIHEETGFPVLIYDQEGRIINATERAASGTCMPVPKKLCSTRQMTMR